MPKLVSHAVSPMDYRKDGAKHIYGSNGHRIYKGKMPPLLQGVGVMQLEIDELGNIRHLNWLRPPSHAGSRMEIERTVRAAAPFPAPVRMGRVSYTDTWLWHESGQFQLDTLTEGQRDKEPPGHPEEPATRRVFSWPCLSCPGRWNSSRGSPAAARGSAGRCAPRRSRAPRG